MAGGQNRQKRKGISRGKRQAREGGRTSRKRLRGKMKRQMRKDVGLAEGYRGLEGEKARMLVSANLGRALLVLPETREWVTVEGVKTSQKGQNGGTCYSARKEEEIGVPQERTQGGRRFHGTRKKGGGFLASRIGASLFYGK